MLLRSTKCAGAGTDSSRNFTAPNRFLHAGTARCRTARSNRMAGGGGRKQPRRGNMTTMRNLTDHSQEHDMLRPPVTSSMAPRSQRIGLCTWFHRQDARADPVPGCSYSDASTADICPQKAGLECRRPIRSTPIFAPSIILLCHISKGLDPCGMSR